MRDRQSFLSKIFTAVSIAGVLLVLAEMVMQYAGSSICPTEGCKVIAASARFGDFPILLIGLSAFSALAVLSLVARPGNRPVLDRTIDLVLVVSLACEGFFTGYQAFRLFTPCIFCLIVFGFLVVLALLRLAAGKKDVIAGFAALLAVFSLFYLVLPAQNVVPFPDDRELVLFYSKECKFCSQVMDEFDQRNIPVQHVPVSDYSGVLKSLGIEHVPTLLVNTGTEKTFLTGIDAIQHYIAAREMQAGVPGGKTNGFIDLFQNPALPSPVPLTEEGACKETTPCN
jgi:hypothetical protein